MKLITRQGNNYCYVEGSEKLFLAIIFQLGENLPWMFSNNIKRLFIVYSDWKYYKKYALFPSPNEFGINFWSFLVVYLMGYLHFFMFFSSSNSPSIRALKLKYFNFTIQYIAISQKLNNLSPLIERAFKKRT